MKRVNHIAQISLIDHLLYHLCEHLGQRVTKNWEKKNEINGSTSRREAHSEKKWKQPMTWKLVENLEHIHEQWTHKRPNRIPLKSKVLNLSGNSVINKSENILDSGCRKTITSECGIFFCSISWRQCRQQRVFSLAPVTSITIIPHYHQTHTHTHDTLFSKLIWLQLVKTRSSLLFIYVHVTYTYTFSSSHHTLCIKIRSFAGFPSAKSKEPAMKIYISSHGKAVTTENRNHWT